MAGKKPDILETLRKADPMHDIRQLIDPPHMRALREQMDSLLNPPYLKHLDSVLGIKDLLPNHDRYLASILSPSAPELAMAQLDSVMSESQPALALASLKSIVNASQLSAAVAAIEDVMSSQKLVSMHENLTSFLGPIGSTFIAANNALSAFSNSRMVAEMEQLAAAYQDLLETSPLASFLVSQKDAEGKPPPQHVQVEGFDSLRIGDSAELEVDAPSSIDHQIVKAIQNGKTAELPSVAIRRLQWAIAALIWFCDMLIRIFETRAAVIALIALLSPATGPAELRSQALQLPVEQRVLLADIRMVNTEGARLRAEPTTKGDVIASLPFALPVEVLEYNDKGWYRVEVETEDGYVEGWTYVTVTTPVPLPKRPRGHNVDTEEL